MRARRSGGVIGDKEFRGTCGLWVVVVHLFYVAFLRVWAVRGERAERCGLNTALDS